MQSYKNRLKEYIRTDIVYTDFMKHPDKNFNDFDMFCIEHCEDIKKLLEENERLNNVLNELEKWLKEVIQEEPLPRTEHFNWVYNEVLDKLNELKESDK